MERKTLLNGSGYFLNLQRQINQLTGNWDEFFQLLEGKFDLNRESQTYGYRKCNILPQNLIFGQENVDNRTCIRLKAIILKGNQFFHVFFALIWIDFLFGSKYTKENRQYCWKKKQVRALIEIILANARLSNFSK